MGYAMLIGLSAVYSLLSLALLVHSRGVIS